MHYYLFVCRFAGNKSTIQSVAHKFDMTESSFYQVSDRVMDFLLSLAPTIIAMPKSNLEKESMANEFKNVSELICIANKKLNIADLRTP